MSSRSAARVKLPASATPKTYRSCTISIGLTYHIHRLNPLHLSRDKPYSYHVAREGPTQATNQGTTMNKQNVLKNAVIPGTIALAAIVLSTVIPFNADT